MWPSCWCAHQPRVISGYVWAHAPPARRSSAGDRRGVVGRHPGPCLGQHAPPRHQRCCSAPGAADEPATHCPGAHHTSGFNGFIDTMLILGAHCPAHPQRFGEDDRVFICDVSGAAPTGQRCVLYNPLCAHGPQCQTQLIDVLRLCCLTCCAGVTTQVARCGPCGVGSSTLQLSRSFHHTWLPRAAPSVCG